MAARKTAVNGKAVKKASGALSLRDQLAAKRSRVTVLRIPIGDEGDAAEHELNEARQGVQIIELLNAKAKSPTDMTKARKRVEAAEAELDRHALTFRFRGLSPDEYDALDSQFTLPDDSTEKFDLRGYTCALLAVATLDSDLSAEEWEAELYQSGKWTKGEVDALREAATAAYANAPAPGIPKG